MSPSELTQTIRDQIPVSKAFAFQVTTCDAQGAKVLGPFHENRNHMNSVFGGSLNTFAILACYAWLFNFLREHSPDRHVLIKRGEIDFLQPVLGDFTAECAAPSVAEQNQLAESLGRGKRSRLNLTATIQFKNQICARFSGEFVAF